MLNIIEIIGKTLEAKGLGAYDEIGGSGSIFANRMFNKENNQIVLKYESDKIFLGQKQQSGKLEVYVYNSNYRKAVDQLQKIYKVLKSTKISDEKSTVKITLKEELNGLDVTNETNLLCVYATYAIDIINN